MNDHDRSNLQFIMSLNEKQFDEWYSSISDDDVDYAMELFKQARTELNMHMHEVIDQIEDTTLAKNVLKKFML
jgi:hypothetical protein